MFLSKVRNGLYLVEQELRTSEEQLSDGDIRNEAQ